MVRVDNGSLAVEVSPYLALGLTMSFPLFGIGLVVELVLMEDALYPPPRYASRCHSQQGWGSDTLRSPAN